MAITQSGNVSFANSGAGASSIQASGLTADSVNDAQVVFVVANAGGLTWTAADPRFALIGASNSGNRSMATFISSTVLAPNPTFTISTPAALALIAVEFVSASGLVDSSSLVAALNSNVGSSAAITPSAANDCLVMFCANDAPTTAVTTPPAGYAEAVPAGGVAGGAFAERAYFLVNPTLSSQQPSIVWNYAPAGNIALTAYVLLKATAGATVAVSASDRAATLADAPGGGRVIPVSATDTAATISEATSEAILAPPSGPDVAATLTDAPRLSIVQGGAGSAPQIFIRAFKRGYFT
jgi:hypothetical protein